MLAQGKWDCNEMKGKSHEIIDIANQIKLEIESDAKDLAPHLLSEVIADQSTLTKSDYLDYVRDSWLTDPSFRLSLLDRLAPKGPLGIRPLVGLKSYIATVTDAFKHQSPAESSPFSEQLIPLAGAGIDYENNKSLPLAGIRDKPDDLPDYSAGQRDQQRPQ